MTFMGAFCSENRPARKRWVWRGARRQPQRVARGGCQGAPACGYYTVAQSVTCGAGASCRPHLRLRPGCRGINVAVRPVSCTARKHARRLRPTRHGAQGDASQAIAAPGHATDQAPPRLPRHRSDGRHYHVHRRRIPRQPPFASVQAANVTSTAHAAIKPSAAPAAMRYARHISLSVSWGLAKLRAGRYGGWRFRFICQTPLGQCGDGDGRDLRACRHGCSRFLQALVAGPQSPRRVTNQTVKASRLTRR